MCQEGLFEGEGQLKTRRTYRCGCQDDNYYFVGRKMVIWRSIASSTNLILSPTEGCTHPSNVEPPDINSSGQNFTIYMAILVSFINLRHLE